MTVFNYNRRSHGYILTVTPLRNTTCSSIGSSSIVTHGNQGKTKTTVTKLMPLPKLARYIVILGLLNPAHLFLSSPATSMPEPCKTLLPPKSASYLKFPMMTSELSKLRMPLSKLLLTTSLTHNQTP